MTILAVGIKDWSNPWVLGDHLLKFSKPANMTLMNIKEGSEYSRGLNVYLLNNSG